MVSGHFTDIGLLALSDPEKARSQLFGAFKRAKCHMGDTAKALGVHPATLRRIVDRLEMRTQLDEAEEEARGTRRHHGRVGGWPLGRKRKPDAA